MNRGRKGGFNSKFNEDIPDELRCKRSDGKQWRCNARAMENKTLCEKHYNQAKKRVAGVSSPSSTFSPKKKVKRKEEPKTTRTSNRDVDVRSKSSRTMTTDSSDYRYSNDSQYASEYRSFGDYSHISDYQSAGEYGHTDDHRMRSYSGSSKKKVDGQKMHMSPQLLMDSPKFKSMKRMLTFIQPLLQQIHRDQCREIALENDLLGDASAKPPRSRLMKDERIYCDNCNTAIIDLYRSCIECSYDLCLNCCRELRQGKLPGGEHSSSADQPSLVRFKSSGKTSGSQYKLPSWHAKHDGGIPCPPSERGGCGSSTLVLKRILKSNWLAKLVAEVNALTSGEAKKLHSSMCTNKVDSNIVDDLRQSAFRSDDSDNFLYCPTAQAVRREGLDNFYSHWLKGEPIIIRNMVDETKEISWEPTILSRAVRDCMQSKMIKVLDCLKWCPVEISINHFFKGYQEGRMHDNGWPEMLKLKDWHPPNFFEERLPHHGTELLRSLPFQEYTNMKHGGIQNLASKIPDGSLQPDFGPKLCFAYGMQEDLGRGNSVTKLHCAVSDTVNVLAHMTEVKLADWQLKRLVKYKKLFKKLMNEERKKGAHSRSQDFPNIGAHAFNIVVQSENEELDMSDLSESSHDSDEEKVASMVSNGENRVKIKGRKDNTQESEESLCGGVLWDIFRRNDVMKIQAYLKMHFHEFRHVNEEPVTHIIHPIHDQIFYLTEEHKMKLKDEFGVEPWTFEQRMGEAVFIPSGCPYQARNLKSCVMVSFDFISPESLKDCVGLTEEFRLLPKEHICKEDKLEVKKLMLYAASRAVKDIKNLMNIS